MSATFKVGDITVSRINGPFEAYVIGRLELKEDGNGLRFSYVEYDLTLEGALSKSVALRAPGGSVWPFLGQN